MSYLFRYSACLACLLSVTADASWACSVCYGDPNSLLSQGMTMGVLVLLLVTGGVLAAFSYFFYTLWRRGRKLSQSSSTTTARN